MGHFNKKKTDKNVNITLKKLKTIHRSKSLDTRTFIPKSSTDKKQWPEKATFKPNANDNVYTVLSELTKPENEEMEIKTIPTVTEPTPGPSGSNKKSGPAGAK